MTRTRNRDLGLGLLALLSLADVFAPVLTDDDQIPMAVALVASVIGLASLALIWYVVRGARRAVTPLIGLRVLSALTAVPAFFVDDASTAMRTLAGVLVALTIAGVALLTMPAPAKVSR